MRFGDLTRVDSCDRFQKQLYSEQIAVFKEKQRSEMSALERELERARDKLAQSSRAYEEHIRGLTAELWRAGEKLLVSRDEADWLRRTQRSGSLMSLQHVHSVRTIVTSKHTSYTWNILFYVLQFSGKLTKLSITHLPQHSVISTLI